MGKALSVGAFPVSGSMLANVQVTIPVAGLLPLLTRFTTHDGLQTLNSPHTMVLDCR